MKRSEYRITVPISKIVRKKNYKILFTVLRIGCYANPRHLKRGNSCVFRERILGRSLSFETCGKIK
ncbi:hypothetical protein LEP1GSC060_3488 [Leptospira weilii serovar Ranarum str. ICFT]|uniref:Uncharacterized protein n=1 Tax=Leptospira weilii serovar Ranarum str. ICFT TaxID=1218598 RepID=N1WHD7_9LEPT|nr:hypothetical protein LEP1GSC060_3488 [Leptospira weilii serovar Ranarum str. ICFT]